MSRKKAEKRKGGTRKHGRSKRPKGVLSSYVRNKISFENYAKQAGIKMKKVL